MYACSMTDPVPLNVFMQMLQDVCERNQYNDGWVRITTDKPRFRIEERRPNCD